MITDFNAPKIFKMQQWNSSDIRSLCIREDWYTKGDCVEYSTMLKYVDEHPCTDLNVYIVARDICEHTEDQTISNIMFCIAHHCIYTFYDIGEE